MLYHITRVIVYAFMISYFMLMHIGSSKGITLLEFNEEELEEQQEVPQVVALEGEEQALEDLPKCPDHRSTFIIKGKPRSILSLPCFTKYHLSPLYLMHQVIRVGWKHLMHRTTLFRYIPLSLYRSRIEYMLSYAQTGRSRRYRWALNHDWQYLLSCKRTMDVINRVWTESMLQVDSCDSVCAD